MRSVPEEEDTVAGPVCGFLILDKPAGRTSHDVVNTVRRRFGIRQVGHTGTLDPMATGVLIVCLGAATRLAEYVPSEPKEYVAEVLFGRQTDTQDITGRVLCTSDASGVTAERLAEVLKGFSGSVRQKPPAFSAIKRGGRPLYERARRGEPAEAPEREVHIHDIELLRFRPGAEASAEIRVLCSAGTYIRTVAHDVGARLGVGAVLSGLRRTRVGPFTVEVAEDPDTAEGLLSPEEALAGLPCGLVQGDALSALRQGAPVHARDVEWTRCGSGELALLHDLERSWYVIAAVSGGSVLPRKVLDCRQAGPLSTLSEGKR